MTTGTEKTGRRKRRGEGRGPQPRLHGDLLSSSLLAYLRRWNAYGYQLVQELAKSGLPSFDSATVYRTLRQLERAGLVSSFWDTSESGPARRMYSLTKAGEAFLDLWLDLFGRYQRMLRSALNSLENLGGEPQDGAAPGEQEISSQGGQDVRDERAG